MVSFRVARFPTFIAFTSHPAPPSGGSGRSFLFGFGIQGYTLKAYNYKAQTIGY